VALVIVGPAIARCSKPREVIVDDGTERAVLRAIEAMKQRLGDQLTVDDLAKAALFSKFHFTRIFQRVTGVSPRRFLSALRLQQAKHLLVSTEMRVADISVYVGYNSVGTFSSRFSRSVGMSPTMYRRRTGYATVIPIDTDIRANRPSSAKLICNVRLATPTPNAVIFIGLFPDRMPEGRPVHCSVLRHDDRIQFDSVPVGTWYLLAQGVTLDACHPAADCDCLDRQVSVATHGPILARPDSVISVDLILRPSRILDPPVLLALLDARKYAMGQLQTTHPAQHPYNQAAA
jgi:AraC-like DNA-binding protein